MSPGYGEWEEIYRKHPLESLPWELGRPRQSLVELVEGGLIGPGRALDACCGAGTNGIYLAQRGFEVVGLDISPSAVRYASQKARDAGVEVQFMVRSFLELPFEDGRFDFVLDSGCFHHVRVEDRAGYIEGMHRVLGAGGLYLLICFSDRNGPAWNHFTEEGLKALFSGRFAVRWTRHAGSVEGDGVVRYFHNALMEKTG